MMFAWQKKSFGLSFTFSPFSPFPLLCVVERQQYITQFSGIMMVLWINKWILMLHKGYWAILFHNRMQKATILCISCPHSGFWLSSLHQSKASKSQVRYKKQWRDMKSNDKVGSRQIYTKVQVAVILLSPCMLSHHPQILHIEEAINIWETDSLSEEKTSIELCITSLHLIN